MSTPAGPSTYRSYSPSWVRWRWNEVLAWLAANGIDPRGVAQDQVARANTTPPRLWYRQVQYDQAGAPLPDPQHPGQPLTVEAEATEAIPLDHFLNQDGGAAT